MIGNEVTNRDHLSITIPLSFLSRLLRSRGSSPLSSILLSTMHFKASIFWVALLIAQLVSSKELIGRAGNDPPLKNIASDSQGIISGSPSRAPGLQNRPSWSQSRASTSAPLDSGLIAKVVSIMKDVDYLKRRVGFLEESAEKAEEEAKIVQHRLGLAERQLEKTRGYMGRKYPEDFPEHMLRQSSTGTERAAST